MAEYARPRAKTTRAVDRAAPSNPLTPGKQTRVGAIASSGIAPQRQAPANPTGSGQALPGVVRARMERAFGADFSAVRIYEGPQAAQLGAEAYTQGDAIYFTPGKYDPDSEHGQALLGHELAHVVQQRAGRVAASQGTGTPVNADHALEAEADAHGAQAARGEVVASGGASPATSAAPAVIQAKATRGAGWGAVWWSPGGEQAWTTIEQRFDSDFMPAARAIRAEGYPLNAQQQSDLSDVRAAEQWDTTPIPYSDGLRLARQLPGLIDRARELEHLTNRVPKQPGEELAHPPDFHVAHHTKSLDEVAAHVGATDAHADGVTGKRVHVVIIDSGWYAHPYFAERYPDAEIDVVQLPAPRFEGDPNPVQPKGRKQDDLNGHGTAMVANVLAIAPDARITMLVCTSDMVALRHAHTLGADVISISRGPTWGGGKGANNDPSVRSGVLDDYQQILAEGREHADHPPIVLDAVGNRGAQGMLSMLPGVISVGGIHADEDGALTASSYTNAYRTDGAYRSKHARGVGDSTASIVKPLVPDIAGLCGSDAHPDYLQLPAQFGSDLEGGATPGWGLASGSSCATPQVAGVVALLRQVDPTLTTEQALDILRSTATSVDRGKGHGDQGLAASDGDWARLINAKAAVAEAQRRKAEK